MGALGQEAHSLKRQDQSRCTCHGLQTPNCKVPGVAIISPGAGGSEQGYRYLGRRCRWGATGPWWWGIKIVGATPCASRCAPTVCARVFLAQLIAEPQAYNSRLMDIAAAQQWAQSQCAGGLSVLIGHSTGAATTMIEAGARNKLGVQGSHGFAAYIALSPQGWGLSLRPMHGQA